MTVYFLALSKGRSLLEQSGLGDRVPIVSIPCQIKSRKVVVGNLRCVKAVNKVSIAD